MSNPSYHLKKKILEVLIQYHNSDLLGDEAEEIMRLIPRQSPSDELAMMQDRIDQLAIGVRKLTQDSSVRPLLEEVSEKLENLIIVIDAYNAEEAPFYGEEINAE